MFNVLRSLVDYGIAKTSEAACLAACLTALRYFLVQRDSNQDDDDCPDNTDKSRVGIHFLGSDLGAFFGSGHNPNEVDFTPKSVIPDRSITLIRRGATSGRIFTSTAPRTKKVACELSIVMSG